MKFTFIDTKAGKARTIHAENIEEARDVVTYHLRVLGNPTVDEMDWNEARKCVGTNTDEFPVYPVDEDVWSASMPGVSRFLDSRKTRADRLYEEELNLGLPVSNS